jgi:hypothetical protein
MEDKQLKKSGRLSKFITILAVLNVSIFLVVNLSAICIGSTESPININLIFKGIIGSWIFSFALFALIPVGQRYMSSKSNSKRSIRILLVGQAILFGLWLIFWLIGK